MIHTLHARISRVIDQTILDLAKRRHLSLDTMRWEGIIRIRELPDCMDYTTYKKWWCPQRDEKGALIRPARMSEREKARYEVAAAHNLITSLGRTQVLTFAGSNITTTAFSQYFSVGTFPINSVQPGDTGVNVEIYRAVPSAFTVTGNTVDISTFFGTAQGNGTLTNCGLWGINATATANSGTLMTHALLNQYLKDSSHTVTFDYLIVLN